VALPDGVPGDAPADTTKDEGAEEVLGLARGGALNLGGMLVTQAVGFLVFVVLGRGLGNEAVGLYSQAFAFLALLELVSLSGFRSGLTRFCAVHRAEGDEASLRGTIRLGLGLGALSSLLLGGLLFALAPWLAHSAFHDDGLEPLLRFVALALPPTVFMQGALSATQGWKTMRYYAGVGLVIVPILRVGLTLGLLAAGAGLKGAMVALLVAQMTGAVLAGLALRSLLGRPRVAPRYRVRELFSFSMVSWLASLASTGLIWADTIILGLYRSSAEVGRYQIISRLMLLAALAMSPINASFAPRIADLYQRRRDDALQRAYVAATGWILRLSLPAFVGLVVFSRELTDIFGKGFTVSTAVVVVLVGGKLADAATGPCGLMLNQSGRVALNMIDNVGVLVVNVLLNLALIPRYGILGSAVAWAISLTAVNVARLVQVRITMRMLPFGIGVAKGIGAAGAALAAGVAFQTAISGPAGLLVGGPVVVAAYVVVLLLLGLPAEDRLLLSELRGGRRKRRRSPSARPFESRIARPNPAPEVLR
jgi:O-antigen/teichoic acid export membrane protein